MTDLRVKLLAYGLVVVLLAGAGFAAAWFWQANAYGTRLARQESAHQSDLANIANAGAAQARAAVERQQVAEQALAQLDIQFTQEKTNALAENERLRRAVADGTRRLRVAGTCSASGGAVPQIPGTTGVGNAGTVELAATAGRNVLDIRAGIIADQSALRTLQAYVRDVCFRD